MRVGEIRQFCRLQAKGQSLIRAAMMQLNLSARAYYHRVQDYSDACAHAFATIQQKPLHLEAQPSPSGLVHSDALPHSERPMTVESFRADHTSAR